MHHDDGYQGQPHKKTKSAKYCKKLKGPHDYQWVQRIKYRLFHGGYDEYHCSACGKKKIVGYP